MISHDHYVPVLKWKMGEYQALNRLADSVKDKITPLIEIPPVGYDFELGTNRESWESHLGDFGKRLKAKWQSARLLRRSKIYPPRGQNRRSARGGIPTRPGARRRVRHRDSRSVSPATDIPAWLLDAQSVRTGAERHCGSLAQTLIMTRSRVTLRVAFPHLESR